MKNIDIVAEACIMEFSKPVEQIYGVEENTWLVHVPKSQTIQIRCGAKTGVGGRTSLIIPRKSLAQNWWTAKV